VRNAGGTLLRGGAYKPRTSPYAFQGLGAEGLALLAEAKAETGLPVVTEIIDPREIEHVLEVADVLQIGSRNMQNYPLLTEAGRSGQPVLLKRGLVEHDRRAAVVGRVRAQEGNESVILCERGIRTFETAYGFTLDLAAVPALKERTSLPVIVDPSHAAGRRELVMPLSLARGRGRRRRPARGGSSAAGGGDLRRTAGAPHRRARPASPKRVRAAAELGGMPWE